MGTMNVSLPDPMKDWVESRTADGRYSNASDYVRDLIRKDQAREAKMAALQAKVDDGLTSGPGEQTMESLLAAAKAALPKAAK